MSETNKKYITKTVAFTEIKLPKLVEVKIADNNFILNGNKHEYVKFLLDVYDKSSTHKNIIDYKSQLVAGHKLSILNINSDDQNIIDEVENWMDEIDLHDSISSASVDYHIFGYCFFQITYLKNGKLNINWMDASTIALGKDLKTFYFSNDWSKYNQSELNRPIPLPIFDPENITSGKPQILMVRKKQSGLVYYAKPYSQSTIQYALMEYDLSTLLLNNTNHNFSPSAIITHIEPSLTEEQQDEIVEDFESLYTGTKQKKIVHLFISDAANKPNVDFFPVRDDMTLYTDAQKIAKNSIAEGHNIVNKALVSLTNDSGVLGDSTSIQDSFELLLKNIIRPTQILFEKSLTKVLQVNFAGVKLKINTESPLKFKAFSENILSQVLTQDEIRAELGKTPLQPGELTNLDVVRSKNKDLNTSQLITPNTIIEQDQANE